MRRPYYKKSHRAWYCTIGGNQFRLGTDKESAKKEYHRLMAAETPITSKTTLAQLIDQFLHLTNENKAPRTFKWYQRHLKCFVQFIGYKLTVNQIKPAHLHRWLERSYKSWGQSDRNGACRAVARAFNWAKKAGLISANPIEGMERPAPGNDGRSLIKSQRVTIALRLHKYTYDQPGLVFHAERTLFFVVVYVYVYVIAVLWPF